MDTATRVVHISEPYDVYIGRAGHGHDGYFGNPHPLGTPCPRCGGIRHNRADCIAAFQQDFDRRVLTDAVYRARVLDLRGKRLGCFCRHSGTSTPCHGDIFTAWLATNPSFIIPTTGTPAIREFRGAYRFLSNPYLLPHSITWRGVTCRSSEIAYQISKTDDRDWIQKLLAAPDLRTMKQIGYALPLRPNWRALRVPIMRDILARKFAHPTLCERLLATGDAPLVEGNTWHDRFWGLELPTGVGQNMLGILLIALRTDLRRATTPPTPPHP